MNQQRINTPNSKCGHLPIMQLSITTTPSLLFFMMLVKIHTAIFMYLCHILMTCYSARLRVPLICLFIRIIQNLITYNTSMLLYRRRLARDRDRHWTQTHLLYM
jgi:hypothetical protein